MEISKRLKPNISLCEEYYGKRSRRSKEGIFKGFNFHLRGEILHGVPLSRQFTYRIILKLIKGKSLSTTEQLQPKKYSYLK
jgi:hypothetical protein